MGVKPECWRNIFFVFYGLSLLFKLQESFNI